MGRRKKKPKKENSISNVNVKKIKEIEIKVKETFDSIRGLASNKEEANLIEHILFNNTNCEMVKTRDNFRNYDGTIHVGTSEECDKIEEEYIEAYVEEDKCPLNPINQDCQYCDEEGKDENGNKKLCDECEFYSHHYKYDDHRNCCEYFVERFDLSKGNF
jgi:hypothetical protein